MDEVCEEIDEEGQGLEGEVADEHQFLLRLGLLLFHNTVAGGVDGAEATPR